MGFGAGDLGDYISKPSFRGFAIQYRDLVQPNIGVGFELGWNTFYEDKATDTYSIENVSYTGKQWRYNNQFPALAAVDYYLKPDESLNPFFGLGIGTMYSSRILDMGQYRFEEVAWHFALRPEVGILLEVASGAQFAITGKYFHGFASGGLEDQSYFTLNVGFVFAE